MSIGFDDKNVYTMPPFFGGLPYPLPPLRYRDTTNLSISYETDGDALQRMLPSGFVLTRPELMISCVNNRGVEWMAGSPYNLIAVNVPVRFEGRKDVLEGVFGLVVWENKATPILPGREMQGVPKVFAEIEDFREFPEGEISAWAHYEGVRFVEIRLSKARDAESAELDLIRSSYKRLNWFGWRQIPKVGEPGAAISEPVLFPQDFHMWSAKIGEGSIDWFVPDWRLNPTQAHIIATLAALPNKGMTGAMMARCENTLRADLARVPI